VYVSRWISQNNKTSKLTIQFVGAVKATGGRGLQPAMDHILENEGNPVPDLSSVSSSSSGSNAQPMDVDEDDEDIDALRALTGKAGAATSSGAAEEAKVSIRSRISRWGRSVSV
jgi:hypothetical protein